MNEAFNDVTQGQGQGQSEGQKLTSSDKQIFAILLLVAFSFFILVTPLYAFNLYSMLFDYTKTPERFVGFICFTILSTRCISLIMV